MIIQKMYFYSTECFINDYVLEPSKLLEKWGVM